MTWHPGGRKNGCISFDHCSNDKADWSTLLFLEKREGKSRLLAQATLRAGVSTSRTRLSMLLASARSRPGHQLRVSSELAQV